MKKIAGTCLALGLAMLAGTAAHAADMPNTLTKKEAAAGWKLLFDGKSLDGWHPLSTTKPPATGDWSVADGAIQCPGSSPGWLASTDAYSDFELKLQFRGSEKVNSGVFLRSDKEGAPNLTGYELQIWDYQPAGYNTGSLVDSVKAWPATILDSQWNNYDVKAVGDHFVVVLNGKTILDAKDSKHTEGLLGFQCQPNMKIEFRGVKVLPLKK
jgi:3-keto-disaccharide hydrolase